jgi:hypothetical protein
MELKSVAVQQSSLVVFDLILQMEIIAAVEIEDMIEGFLKGGAVNSRIISACLGMPEKFLPRAKQPGKR